MPDILSVADHADMIVNGYAFSKSNDSVRVLNLNNPASACVPKGFTTACTIIIPMDTVDC